MRTSIYCLVLCLSIGLVTACQPAKENAPPALFAQIPPLDNAPAVEKTRPLVLPDDHQAHPQHQLEWWYLTATLEDHQQTPYAMQFTLFRLRLPEASSHWHNDQLWMAHVALRSQQQQWFSERLARGGVGNAGQENAPFRLFLDDWQWRSKAADTPFPASLQLTLDEHTQLQLTMESHGPFVKQGEQGYSIKTADGDYRSYYYSQPFIQVQAELHQQQQTQQLQGQGWYDHEWTSHLAGPEALGWDWFSLHLEDGRKLMLFRMNTRDRAPYLTGSLISPIGEITPLQPQHIQLTPLHYSSLPAAKVPTQWQLDIPLHNLALKLSAFMADQWNPAQLPYYEGRVEVSGSHQGRGFMELTGYAL